MKIVIVYMLLVLAEVVVFTWGWFNGLVAFVFIITIIETNLGKDKEKQYAKLGELVIKNLDRKFMR